jgi:acylphosphatase
MSVLRATVFGHVQGVGFRWYARGRARRFELTGRAANRADGAVEIEAEGDAAALAGFLAALREGPGRVDRIEHVVAEGTLGAHDFTME